jgi:hypothetical protein
MSGLLDKARALLPEFLGRLAFRRESGPLATVDSLAGFVSTRAAFIAQHTLYGYLKTRMGTRYRSLFEDDTFVASIDIAKLHVYAACLADLALFAVWRTRTDAGAALADEDCCRLALVCFRRGLADNAASVAAVAAFSPAEAEAAFERRLAFWNWDAARQAADIFSESPAALVRWAPIAPELKQFDQEIVENSVKFKWLEVRADFARRLEPTAVAAEAAAARSPA